MFDQFIHLSAYKLRTESNVQYSDGAAVRLVFLPVSY